jgi:hypothetical protein
MEGGMRTYAWPRNKTGRLEKTTLLAQFDHYKARCAELEVENANLRAFLEAERRLNNTLESRLLLYGETA